MRTDHVFYRLFKDYPEALFNLLGEHPTSPYVMSAVQVKELTFSFDGVLVPENGEGTIYFLGVQFYDDPKQIVEHLVIVMYIDGLRLTSPPRDGRIGK